MKFSSLCSDRGSGWYSYCKMYPALRTQTFAKLFFLISSTGLFLYVTLAFYTFRTAYTVGQTEKYQDPRKDTSNMERDHKYLKYILIWTYKDNPIESFPYGQHIFADRKCEHRNCYLTTDKKILKDDYNNFDAIVFNISAVKNWRKVNLPKTRLQRQKYIFYSVAPSVDNPICHNNVDNYFNWTWTYKLNSDIVSPFIEVTDIHGNVVAPIPNVKWTTNPALLADMEIGVRKPKRKVMIMNNCNTWEQREVFVRELEAAFRMYLMTFDIYGCQNLECLEDSCLQDENYYFYLAYEDSIAEDYVTNKVTKAYSHGMVPIVIGGADYSKFLPNGSYIKADSKSAKNLAAKLYYIIRNPFLYYGYFNWQQSYSILETEQFKGICELCAYLNDESKFGKFSTYKDFRNWWYPGPLDDVCISKSVEI